MRIFILFFCLLLTNCFAQRSLRDSSITAVLFAPNYSFNLTGADMNDRWGFNNKVGLTVGVKLKSNLTIALDGGFIFGNRMKDTSIFTGVYNSFGTITGLSGAPADVLFLMRGATGYLDIGYVIPKIGGINPNSGLWISVGFGYLMHKIRIESLYDDVPQLEGDYRKGYDKLSMGFSMHQFIGYMFHGNKQFLNFYAGLEVTEGFTRNIRKYNFDTEGPETDMKFDMLYSAKVAWMIPMYKRAPQAYYID